MDNGTGNGINDLNPTDDPFWIDDAWLDTIVVLSLTTFVLCLMGLAKVRVKGSNKRISQAIAASPPSPRFHSIRSLAHPPCLAFRSPPGLNVENGHLVRNFWHGCLDSRLLGQ